MQKVIWSVCCPCKIKIFLRLPVKNAVLTSDNLQKWGWIGPHLCVLRGHNKESVEHITLRCDFACSIWSTCTSSDPPSSHVFSIWDHMHNIRLDDMLSHVLVTVIVRNITIGYSIEECIQTIYPLTSNFE